MTRFNFPNQNLKITQLCTVCISNSRHLRPLLFIKWRWNEWYFLKTVETQIWKQIPSKIESFIGQEKHLIFNIFAKKMPVTPAQSSLQTGKQVNSDETLKAIPTSIALNGKKHWINL